MIDLVYIDHHELMANSRILPHTPYEKAEVDIVFIAL